MKVVFTTSVSRRVAWAYAVLVLAVSSLPSARLPDLGVHNIDKALHFVQYGVLGYLVARGWGPGRQAGPFRLGQWLPAILLLIFAGLDELHQRWIPGRTPEWWDWASDSSGIMLCYMAGFLSNRRTRAA